jgi:hypothetical protein
MPFSWWARATHKARRAPAVNRASSNVLNCPLGVRSCPVMDPLAKTISPAARAASDHRLSFGLRDLCQASPLA